MAKIQSSDGVSNSLFKDAVCPKPSPSGNWGGMGEPLSDGQAETKGELPGVQFSDVVGGASGKVDFMKVSGKKPGR